VTEASSMTEVGTFILEEAPTETLVVLGVHGTDYRLELTPAVAPADFPPLRSERNRRIRGVISARALKMHQASAGGRFIEPVHGRPRIVQGTVYAVDAENDRLLMDVVVPMWVSVESAVTGQSASDFSQGDMLNFYVESDIGFSPS
jgi:hypothetical protein